MLTAAEFENDVRELLRLQGWTITTETLVGHKRVDCYAEKTDSLGSKQRIAVECKAWTDMLTQRDVATVYVDYHSLVEANLIDAVLLVTSNGVSPAADTYVRETRSLRHLTHAQLLNALIDFQLHLRGLAASYMNDEVSKYYVQQSYVDGQVPLEDHLLEWLDSADCRPVAILGGYGYGKTTLVKRLAYVLATRHMADPAARVPVVIPLATIATDQTLEGLLGRQFTSVTVCSGYNYALFSSLNARGRFVFLLDGFDEMKKTMSWDSLLFNLTQLNHLVTPESKVILLGRPSAFLSSDEQDEALHGRVKRLGIERRIPGWPDYRELHLRQFSRQQVTAFIQNYIAILQVTNPEEAEKRRRISKYLEDVDSRQGKRLIDLASRPVQLRMLMELLPEYTGSIDRLTVALLYSEFIDLLLRREAAKPARTSFSKEQRLGFASRLAYWMWRDDQRSDLDVTRIPDELFEGYLSNVPRDVHSVDIKRDLLSGGFLDRKPPNVFYFPHRSFQEYLVAEALVMTAKMRPAELADCPYLSPEATSFFIELSGKSLILTLRKRWSPPAEPSKNLRDLINTACAHYELDLLKATSAVAGATASRKDDIASQKERAALLRRLELVGVVSGRVRRPPKHSVKKKQGTSTHRKQGVTRKHQYRADDSD